MPDEKAETELPSAKAAWHDFRPLVAGRRKRARPTMALRDDGQALLYPGKEHTIYGESESGKSMFEVMTVKDCLDNDQPVAVLDFEEGDEIGWGSRLIEAGVDRRKLRSLKWFRYATPEDANEARACLADVLEMRPALLILEGVSAAYAMFGWQVKENDSAGEYRQTLVKPCIANGIATLSSDHIIKSTEGNGRYAIGGVMKLNMVNGASYLLVNKESIVPHGSGHSLIMCTKDRVGSVKENSRPTKDPMLRLAGVLRVDSTGPRLDITITAPTDRDMPAPGDQLDREFMEKLVEIVERKPGLSDAGVATEAGTTRTAGGNKVGKHLVIAENEGFIHNRGSDTRHSWYPGTSDMRAHRVEPKGAKRIRRKTVEAQGL